MIFALKVCFLFTIFGMMAFAHQAHGEEVDSVLQKELKASQQAGEDWLKVVDGGNYAGSWDESSPIFQATVTKDQWVQLMQQTRKPLGALDSRKLIDQRTAKDPKGLPQGDYMVLLYETSFFHAKKAIELVTLIHTGEGVWKVLTYQVNQAG